MHIGHWEQKNTMNSSTFLSIIIPIYKVEPYLRDCLDSIAASPLDCWEAVLVDDGSPDRCPQICDEYAAKDARFRVIHQENAGVSAARNAGLDDAQGEWVWFVDGDDLVDMRPVGDMMAWLEGHRETDLVMFDMERFQDGTTPRRQDYSFSVTDGHLSKNDFLMKQVCYHHQRLWYRKPQGRFTCGIRVAEDLEFQYKYLTQCQYPVRMEATLYYYRQHRASATGDAAYRVRAIEDIPVVLDHLAEWSRMNNVTPEPWIDYRIMKLLQNLLYSASLVPSLDMQSFQVTIKNIVSTYSALGFPLTGNKKIRLAEWNVKVYFLLNKLYLKLKGYDTQTDSL